MLDLPDSWVWDFWFADDGENYHLFFLYASRALHDPERRHGRAGIGHAVSHDLRQWERVADALVHDDPPAFDDMACWTGSVVRHPDGRWFLFYTGATLASDGRNVQTIGLATSDDLLVWRREPGPLLRADPRWYETLPVSEWHDEAFRDPWVFPDPSGDGWHMLITARATTGPVYGRGVIGHARSDDLLNWTLEPPLTEPGDRGFGQLEVSQATEVDGRPVLLFSCLGEHVGPARRGVTGGVWAAPAESLLGPYAIDEAYPLTDDRLYVGRVLHDREGEAHFFAFHNVDEEVSFRGGVSDPMSIRWEGDRLVVDEKAVRASAPMNSADVSADRPQVM
ncbi:MAG: glycoside hydrolase family 68 protein [Propionibacteriaceae bacterium]|jgi:beta-fructofuranosidase|nr:glycoside hydrolase family 68 protein [Propionibacteriaceae bacterium]